MLIFRVLYIVCEITCVTNAAKILGIFHLPSYSHYQLGEVLLKELASRGHDVTVITPMEEKQKIKNIRTIYVDNAMDVLKESKLDAFTLADESAITSIFQVAKSITPLIENTLNHTNVQKLIKSKEKFDLVILERLINEAFHGFCFHFEAHCIISSPIPPSLTANTQMGIFIPPSYLPEMHTRFSSKMNFFERLYNGIVHVISTLVFHFQILPAQNELMHKYFPAVPHLTDVFYNVSLTLFNSHISTSTPIPVLPNMIDIGGYHIKPVKALPPDLQEYLDNAKEGVAFFSMGSYLRSQDLSDNRREAILKTFAALNVKVLWKWENESLPGQPPNVKIIKWVPQNDVLAHPNIKLFITHGGLLSTLEAIYHGVPVVGIPIYGDQYLNMRIVEENNHGITVGLSDLTGDQLPKAINAVLQDPKYLDNARSRSNILRDNPQNPLEKAIFWIEYVLRHNGAHHLKTAALNLRWYQHFLLDVVAFFAVLVTAPILICYVTYKTRRSSRKNYTIKEKEE
ncbi:hypothetical protein PPYR_05754 [Photinus pyralis]|uniref:UDP-glucuronosyltransferase n=1 Tax=Photinus pyralis TaxID=7054 RepID=A0A5N4AVY9_PHOPY|nr:UDP-glucuronosyltransferase 2C1-like [Photinus pyralis]KAB0801400.1 hypothetical protein PPYR_05754 [Photinus pyralis]